METKDEKKVADFATLADKFLELEQEEFGGPAQGEAAVWREQITQAIGTARLHREELGVLLVHGRKHFKKDRVWLRVIDLVKKATGYRSRRSIETLMDDATRARGLRNASADRYQALECCGVVAAETRWAKLIEELSKDRAASPEALHASTLVQQILSIIAQRGGANAAELWGTLVRSGIFGTIEPSEFSALLRAMGMRDLIAQDHGGTILPGLLGEKLINQFDFYSAFTSGEEFRIIAEGQVLGSLPIERPLTSGQRIIFGGRRWKVQDIDARGKIVFVVRDRGGVPRHLTGLAELSTIVCAKK